jgi:hypothetical protein
MRCLAIKMALKTLEERRAEKQAKKLARRQSETSRESTAAKARKASKIAHVRAGMVGMALEWSDTNPLGNDGESALKANNKNPKQLNCAQEMWNDEYYRKWIIGEVFTWEATVTLNFRLIRPRPGKTHRQDIIIARHTCRLRCPINGENTEINNEIEKQIMAEFIANAARPDTDKNKGVFEVAEYKIVCVGA